MKKIYLFLLSQILLLTVSGQNFEGKITYRLTSIDSSTNLKSSEIDEEYFKDGDFKVINIDSSYRFEWYDKRKDKYISLKRDADTFKTTKETLPFEAKI